MLRSKMHVVGLIEVATFFPFFDGCLCIDGKAILQQVVTQILARFGFQHVKIKMNTVEDAFVQAFPMHWASFEQGSWTI